MIDYRTRILKRGVRTLSVFLPVFSFRPALALQFVSPRLAALESFRVSTPSSHPVSKHGEEETSPEGANEGDNRKTDNSVRNSRQTVPKTLGKTVTGCLPCGLAALLLHLRWEASRREGWLSTGNTPKASQGHIVNVNGILTNFDLVHSKQKAPHHRHVSVLLGNVCRAPELFRESPSVEVSPQLRVAEHSTFLGQAI